MIEYRWVNSDERQGQLHKHLKGKRKSINSQIIYNELKRMDLVEKGLEDICKVYVHRESNFVFIDFEKGQIPLFNWSKKRLDAYKEVMLETFSFLIFIFWNYYSDYLILKKETIRLNTLVDIAEELNSFENWEITAKSVLEKCREAIGAEISAYYEADFTSGIGLLKYYNEDLWTNEKRDQIQRINYFSEERPRSATLYSIEKKKPYIVNDKKEDERYLEIFKEMHSCITAPVVPQDRRKGAILMEGHRVEQFSIDDAEFLTLFGNLFGNSLQYKIVLDILEEIHAKTNIEELGSFLQDICMLVCELMMSSACAIWMKEEGEENKLIIKGSYGLPIEYAKSVNLDPNKGCTGKVFSAMKPYTVQEIEKDKIIQYKEDLLKMGFKSMMIHPLISGGFPKGTINIYDKISAGYSKGMMHLLSLIAVHVASSIAVWEDRTHREDALSNLARVVGHDLKSPMVSMKGYINLIKKSIRKYSPDHIEYRKKGKAIEYQLENISSGIDSAINTVNNFIEAAIDPISIMREKQRKVRRSKIAINPIDILYKSLYIFQSEFEERKIYYEVDQGNINKKWLEVYIDKGDLKIAFDAIIDNIKKYAYSNTKIYILVSETNQFIDYEFINIGIPIPKGFEEKIFDESVRAPNASKKHPEGQGLGMWRAREALKEYAGTVVLSVNNNINNRRNKVGFKVRIPKVLRRPRR